MKWMCIAALMLGSLPARAQDRDTGKAPAIRGLVIDVGGHPIAGASVSVVGTQVRTTSGADGSYAIEGLKPGSYELHVEAPAYDSGVVAIDVLSGQVASGDIVLGKAGSAAEEIVVTASRLPEKLLDAPASIESVDERELATTGGASYLSALANKKGIDFANTGINEQRISARGFATLFYSRMLEMVDGRVATLPGTGLPQGNLLPTTSLDMRAIEVVVGPASALYGPNAHDGVINIVTKTPWDESGVAASVRGGSQDLMDAQARVAGIVANQFGWKINGQVLRAIDFDPDPNSQSHYYGTHIFEKQLVGEYDVGSLKLDGTLYYKKNGWLLQGTYGWSENDGFALTNLGRNHIRGWDVDDESMQLSSKRWYARVTRTGNDGGRTYALNTLAAVAEKLGGVPTDPAALEALRRQIEYVDHSQLYDSELQYRDVLANISLTTGVQGKYYMPDSQGTYLDDKMKPLRATEIGGYLQLERAILGERLNLVGAARLDHHSDYDAQFSPKTAVVYSPTPLQKIRVGYNRAFKSPTILENHLLVRDVNVGNASGFIIKDAMGNVLSRIDPLRPEQVNSLEVGYKAELGEHVFVDAVAYNSWYDNFISPLHPVANPASMTMPTFAFRPDGSEIAAGTAAAGTLLTYTNFGQAVVRGLDVGADWAITRKIQLSASSSLIDLASFTSTDPLSKSLPLNAPEYKLKGSLLVQNLGLRNSFGRISGRWNSAYVFQSGYWDSEKLLGGELPSRFVMDVSAGYQFSGGISLLAVVNNVFDDHNLDVLGSPIVGRFGYLQLSYTHPGLSY